jgi:tetratricopeptide (TPR) repeat protein
MKRIWALALLVSAALIGSVLAWNGVRQEREFRRLIAAGESALAREQTSVAIEAFSGAVALKPASMLGYLKRGDTYRRRGELAPALRDLRQASLLDASATRPLELLGDVNMAMGRVQRASEDYRQFVGLDDRSPRVLYKLALAWYRNGQAALAIDPLRQAIQIDDRFSEAHYLLGLCLRDRGRNADAERELRKAVSVNAALPSARAELADLYLAIGRVRDAIEQLEALAALDPTRAEPLIAVALAQARLGRIDSAVAALGRAADRHPGEAAIYTALGRVWLQAAEVREDRGAVSKAIEALQPSAARTQNADTLTLYGRALFLAGDSDRAERILRQATTELPVDPIAFLYLAAAAQRMHHADIARAALVDYVAVSSRSEADAVTQVSELTVLQQRLRSTGVRRFAGS